MDKKTIWLIISLMSLAVLGIAALQFYWINWSIQLGKQQFEVKVQEALYSISQKLVEQEEYDLMYQPKGIRVEINSEEKITTKNGEIINIKKSVKSSSTFTNDDEYFRLVHENDCDCHDCTREKEKLRADKMEKLERRVTERGFLAIEKRIPGLLHFEKLVDQELKSRGIRTEFKYGVYSTKKNCFVIKDGHFQVDDMGPKVLVNNTYTADNNLMDSGFKIPLYARGINTPGYLVVYFPYLNSLAWKSAWKTLLMALIFISIIMLCFVYSVQVIIRQKKISEMKTDFINNMTHEFKTPIATISLAADSITSPMISGNADKVNRFADIIKQENKRMLSQVEKVLQMAKFDNENLKLKITELDIHNLVKEAVSNVSLQVEQKNGEVSSILEAKNPIIMGDKTHISSMIHNLLDNANKYSPKNPMISVSTRNVRNGVEVIVTDKGIGMSSEARKHIFDKFYRVHTGNLHDVKGFGLGLSYVKALMTAHNGTVTVSSELGKGSSFSLYFPFMQSIE